jgi:NTE family protein
MEEKYTFKDGDQRSSGRDLREKKDGTALYARTTYLPNKPSDRHGIALCLSGGGFRAALFHLGALRRLNELGILTQVDQLSAVSGGSIFASYLATALSSRLANETSIRDWDAQVAIPFRAFTQANLRTRPLLKWLALPWNWATTSLPVEDMTRSFERTLTPLQLKDLPERPQFLFCSTDMTFGCNWVFGKDQIEDFREEQQHRLFSSGGFSLGRATAASACFPPVFDAMHLTANNKQVAYSKRDRALLKQGSAEDIRLTDGGVYDNLGLEPVWKSARTILVSDGGAVFQIHSNRTLPMRLLRYSSIIDHQVGSLRRRWLIASFLDQEMEGAYWGIGSTSEHYYTSALGYSEEVIDQVISRIRTDLDAFTPAEVAVLENHGYCLAEAAIQQHVKGLIKEPTLPFHLPHPEWMDEYSVRNALWQSDKHTLLGRGWRQALWG